LRVSGNQHKYYLRMTKESLKTLIADIDALIREQPWCDFHVISYADSKLTIAGGTDLVYYHTLEIVFQGVFFFLGFPQGWRSDTKSSVFIIPDNGPELNLKFEIESGYQLFLFKTEDYQQNVIIAAESLTYNRDTVYYYDRPNLGNGERVAEFVKAKQIN